MKTIKKHHYPHYSNAEYCLVVRDHFVYKYCYESEKFTKYFRIPASKNSILGKLKDFVARYILRYFSQAIGLSHVIELPNNIVIVIYDKIYRFDPVTDGDCAKAIFDLNTHGILPPLRNGVAVTPKGNLYFAEYANIKGRDTRIIGITNSGQSVKSVYTFHGSKIKHAHGIYWDKYRERLWVTTGDSDNESNFYYTEDDFNTLVHFAGGDQSWRAVSLMFFEDSIAWGMDAGKDAKESDINYIYRYTFSTMKRENVQQIDAPAYHCISTVSGWYYLGVNYEPGCKQKIEPQAAIWFTKDGKTWQRLKSLNYHASPKINGSKYAYLYLPSGEIPDEGCLVTGANIGISSGLLSLINHKEKQQEFK